MWVHDGKHWALEVTPTWALGARVGAPGAALALNFHFSSPPIPCVVLAAKIHFTGLLMPFVGAMPHVCVGGLSNSTRQPGPHPIPP